MDKTMKTRTLAGVMLAAALIFAGVPAYAADTTTGNTSATAEASSTSTTGTAGTASATTGTVSTGTTTATGTTSNAPATTAPAIDMSAVLAAKSGPDVQVFVNGQPVSFEEQPIIIDGTTLVPFRAIFEKLGFQVGWDGDTQTVTGKNDQLQIKLQIGSDQADVNGTSQTLTAAPQLLGAGTTFVPLRFIGEASGLDVHWDNLSRSVWISPAADNVKAVVEQNIQFTAAENGPGVMSTIDEASPAYGQTGQLLNQLFAAYDLSYKLDEVQVEAVKDDAAAVLTVITTHKVQGPAFRDNQTTAVQQLKKVNGAWKIELSKPLKLDYLNADKYIDQQPTVSDADKKAILDTIEQARADAEKEDFTALEKLYSPDYPNLTQLMAAAKYMSASYDLKFEDSNVRIIQATADTATVRMNEKVSLVKGPAFNNYTSDTVTMLKKQTDGSWIITNDDTITTNYLQ